MRLQTIINLAVVSCAVSLMAQSLPAQNATRPNIVIIVADDLGYADIGAQGISKDVKTPNIDSIAANGVRFTNAYVSSAVCSPSRAGFLTGRYQQRFGFEGNALPNREPHIGLPLDQITLANEMKRAGYVTGMVGKWHLGVEPQFRPPKRGFDEFFGFLGGAHSYNNPELDGENAVRRGDEPIEEKAYLTTAFTREAVSFIDRQKEKPFFLYVPFNAPHTPQQSPPRYVEPFAGVEDQKRKMMLAMMASLDEGVGKILDKLREAKLEENTLVIFFSDNGGPTEGNASRNTPLRGFKGQLWEGGIRVPFMMQLKGRIPAGRVIDAPIITLDIFPTALALANVEAKMQLDGVNLLPLLEGKSQERPHETLYWRMNPQWAIRDGDFKLVTTFDGKPRLFDLAKDPGESKDLSASEPQILGRLKKKYDAWNATLAEPKWPIKQEGQHSADAALKGLGSP